MEQTMNAAEIIQIITAIGTLIGVIVGAVLTLRNGWKTDIVAAHVNSSATKAQEEIRALQSQLAGLKADMAEKKEIAALLASKVPTPAPGPTPFAGSPVIPVEIVNEQTNPVPVVTPD